MEDLLFASLKDLARAIRRKTVSSEELVAAYLNRIDGINPVLNAVVQLTPESALEKALKADAALARGDIKGPLHGIPMTIKDSLDTAGVITSAGTEGRRDFVPDRDATVVARLRSAGAILLGKTNTPELTLSGETDNFVYGRTNNPYDPARTPGGSSGGPAAAVAAGMSPFDIGSDTAGSIRLPAHFCGIAGIKPTAGRVPRTGHIISFDMGALDSLTQIGPMGRFVEDLILTLPVIAGPDWRDPAMVPMPLGDPDTVDLKRLRVAFYTDNGIATPTPETVGAVHDAARALVDAGMTVEETRPPEIEEAPTVWGRLFTADGGAKVKWLLESAGTTRLHPFLQWTQHAKAMSTAEFGEWLSRRDRLRSGMLSFMKDFDLMIGPVCPTPAVGHGHMGGNEFTYTKTYNLTGWPSVVFRAGTSPDGLPIDVQVVARPWREDVALAVARYLESVLGGWQRPVEGKGGTGSSALG
jgi:amidase